MRHTYNKPTISINYWTVHSNQLKKLYDFFTQRFPESNIEITIETHEGHNRTCENFNEYLEEIPKIFSNNETVSKIEISEREQSDSHNFKQMWVSINFGDYPSASMYIIGGDVDGSQKDWVEGAYAELIHLKEIFEITDGKVKKILEKEYDNIVFDPNEELYKKIIDSLKPSDKKNDSQTIVLQQPSHKETWFNRLIWPIVVGLIIACIAYLLGWN